MTDINTTIIPKTLEDLYTKGDYDALLVKFLKQKSSQDTGVFHFNLGTLYGKMEMYPAARYNIEKSISEGFLNTMSLNNLDTVKNNLDLNGVSVSYSGFENSLDTALMIPKDVYGTFSLILLMVVAITISMKIMKSYLAIAVTISIALAPYLFNIIFLSNISSAVALKDIQAHEGPSAIFEKTSSVNAGSKIIVGKKDKNWYLIKYPLNLSGWIKAKDLAFF